MQAIQNLFTSLPIVEDIFLNPVGLLAVLAVIPLLIFYLMKPKPEEQVMPSMMFFREEKEDEKLRKAYRKLISNLPLLLQVLAVLTFAAAFANPYINISEASENTVIVLDRSASVKPDFEPLKDRVESEAGESNTLITASDEVQVKLENAGRAELKRELERMKAVETETNIVSALEVAENYEGKLVLASDLDQTLDNRDVASRIDDMAARTVETVSPDVTNQWGITSIEPGRDQTTVEVSNFQVVAETLEVSHGDKMEAVQLDPGESEQISFTGSPGRNVIELPQDDMKSDNTASYVIPEAQNVTVRYLGSLNRYMEEALNLIEGIKLQQVETELGEADVYIISDEIRSRGRRNRLEEKVSEGSSAIILPGSSALSSVLGFETATSSSTDNLKVNQPLNIPVGETELVDRNLTSGESFTTPEYAIRQMEYENGEVIVYNIVGDEFGKNILYPVFWRDVLNSLVDRPDISKLNLETGETVETEEVDSPTGRKYEGRIELNQTGVYTTDDRTYAANLESRDESNIEQRSYSGTVDQAGASEQESIQHLAVLLLVLLICADAVYLWYRGDL